jgi:hypothetical protein
MSLVSIKKRAYDGTLEVEHLLKEAAHPSDALAQLLDALGKELEWQVWDETNDGNHFVPFASWASVIATYCREGYPGLVRLSSDPVLGSFVIALLEELKTKEALDALLYAFKGYLTEPGRDIAISFCVAKAVNLMLSFKPSIEAEPAQADELQSFLLRLYASAQTDGQRGTALAALRGIGNEAAANFADSICLSSPWDKVPQLVARHIRKRLRASRSTPASQ